VDVPEIHPVFKWCQKIWSPWSLIPKWSTTPKCWCLPEEYWPSLLIRGVLLYSSFGTILGVNAPINSQGWFVNTWLTLPGFKTPCWSIVVGDYTPKLLLEIVTFHEPVRWESNVTSCRVSSSAWDIMCNFRWTFGLQTLSLFIFLHPLWLHPRVIKCDKDTFHKWDSKLYCGECPQKSIPFMAWLPIGWEKMWQKKPKCPKYHYPFKWLYSTYYISVSYLYHYYHHLWDMKQILTLPYY
jgi:hypothetical protein